MPSRERIASRSHFGGETLMQTRHVVSDHPAAIIKFPKADRNVWLRPAKHNGQLIEKYHWQRQARVLWFWDFGLQHVTDAFLIWVFVLFAAVWYSASLLWRIHFPQGTHVPERPYDDSVGYLSRYNRTSANIFPLARPQTKCIRSIRHL